MKKGQEKVLLLWLPTIVSVLLVAVCFTSCAPSPPGYFHYGGIPFFGFPVGLVGLGVYFLPTIVAALRHKRNMLGIVLLNVFAGWTVIGWIIALVWSFATDK